jgi:hypothetical protein
MPSRKFRQPFWPQSRKKAWADLAVQIGGDITKAYTLLGEAVFEKQVGDWPLRLTEDYANNTVITTLRAPFLNPKPHHLELKLRKTGFWKFFYQPLSTRPQDKTGFPHIDNECTIHTNQLALLKRFLSEDETRALILRQPLFFTLEIKNKPGLFRDKYGEGVDDLSITISKAIRNVEHLKSFFSLMERTLSFLELHRQTSEKMLLEEHSTTENSVPQTLLEIFRTELDEVLAFFGTQIERHQGTLTARFVHPDALVAGEAFLQITLPTLPAYVSGISLKAPHSPLGSDLSIRTKRNLLEFFRQNNGPTDLKSGFHIENGDEHETHLDLCRKVLLQLAPHQADLKWTESSFQAEISDVSGYKLKDCLYSTLELWRKSVRHACGFKDA